MVKTRVIRLRVIEDPNAHDRSAFCAFHSFLVEVQTNAAYIHADACVKTTWRLELRAPFVARKTMAVIRSVSKKVDCHIDVYKVSTVPSAIQCKTLLPVAYLTNCSF